jgi:hypothetical protein
MRSPHAAMTRATPRMNAAINEEMGKKSSISQSSWVSKASREADKAPDAAIARGFGIRVAGSRGRPRFRVVVTARRGD